MKYIKLKSNNAYTVIEILMVISLVAIMATLSIGNFNESLSQSKFDAAYKELLQIRKGLIGDLENTTIEGERVRFGYLGDMGGIPTTAQGLAAMVAQPTGVSGWAISTTANIGHGWNGPYLVSNTDNDINTDPWGNPYVYNSTASIPYVLSYGADGALGGSDEAQDIQIDLPLSIRTAVVSGQITTSGSIFKSTAHVEIFYPDGSGGITSQTQNLVAGDEGGFSFNNIPFGIRSVKVQIPDNVSPQIVLGPLIFTVDNQNYRISANALDANINNYNNINCNTIDNIHLGAGSVSVEEIDGGNAAKTTTRLKFTLDIDKSFSISELYVANYDGTNAAGNNDNKLVNISVGGVVYGCKASLNHNVNKGTLYRTFAAGTDCNGASGSVSLSGDPNSNPNVTLSSAWGIASGDEIYSFLDFKRISSGDVTSTKLKLGCDLITITWPTSW